MTSSLPHRINWLKERKSSNTQVFFTQLTTARITTLYKRPFNLIRDAVLTWKAKILLEYSFALFIFFGSLSFINFNHERYNRNLEKLDGLLSNLKTEF